MTAEAASRPVFFNPRLLVCQKPQRRIPATQRHLRTVRADLLPAWTFAPTSKGSGHLIRSG